MVQHASLSGIELHEPKGVETASFGDIYFADGAGSGAWLSVFDVVLNANKATLLVEFADISTADSIYVPMSWAGLIYKISVCLQGSITTANSVVTAYNAAGNSMGSVNILYSGSAAGQIFTFTPISNNVVVDNSFIRITTDGGSSGVAKAIVAIDIGYVSG